MDLRKEEILIRQAKAIRSGENKPFGELYEFYYPKVRGYFLTRTGDEKKAEELSSEVFEKALAGLGCFQWQGVPFSAWLFKIAQNTLFDTFRSERAKPKTSIEKLPPLKTEETGPEEMAIQTESYEVLEQLLFNLPKRETHQSSDRQAHGPLRDKYRNNSLPCPSKTPPRLAKPIGLR